MTSLTSAVMTIRSLFYVLVLNKDFSVKLDKNGPYLVPILTKSPYFFKSLTEEKISIPFGGSFLSEVFSIVYPNFRLHYSRLHQGLFVSTSKKSFPIHILSKTRSQFFQKLVPIAQLLQLFTLFLYGSPFLFKIVFLFPNFLCFF